MKPIIALLTTTVYLATAISPAHSVETRAGACAVRTAQLAAMPVAGGEVQQRVVAAGVSATPYEPVQGYFSSWRSSPAEPPGLKVRRASKTVMAILIFVANSLGLTIFKSSQMDALLYAGFGLVILTLVITAWQDLPAAQLISLENALLGAVSFVIEFSVFRQLDPLSFILFTANAAGLALLQSDEGRRYRLFFFAASGMGAFLLTFLWYWDLSFLSAMIFGFFGSRKLKALQKLGTSRGLRFAIATPEDAAGIARIYFEEEMESLSKVEEVWLEAIQDPALDASGKKKDGKQICLVVKQKHTVVGVIRASRQVFAKSKETIVHLSDMCVAEEMRRKGIGEAMISEIVHLVNCAWPDLQVVFTDIAGKNKNKRPGYLRHFEAVNEKDLGISQVLNFTVYRQQINDLKRVFFPGLLDSPWKDKWVSSTAEEKHDQPVTLAASLSGKHTFIKFGARIFSILCIAGLGIWILVTDMSWIGKVIGAAAITAGIVIVFAGPEQMARWGFLVANRYVPAWLQNLVSKHTDAKKGPRRSGPRRAKDRQDAGADLAAYFSLPTHLPFAASGIAGVRESFMPANELAHIRRLSLLRAWRHRLLKLKGVSTLDVPLMRGDHTLLMLYGVLAGLSFLTAIFIGAFWLIGTESSSLFAVLYLIATLYAGLKLLFAITMGKWLWGPKAKKGAELFTILTFLFIPVPVWFLLTHFGILMLHPMFLLFFYIITHSQFGGFTYVKLGLDHLRFLNTFNSAMKALLSGADRSAQQTEMPMNIKLLKTMAAKLSLRHPLCEIVWTDRDDFIFMPRRTKDGKIQLIVSLAFAIDHGKIQNRRLQRMLRNDIEGRIKRWIKNSMRESRTNAAASGLEPLNIEEKEDGKSATVNATNLRQGHHSLMSDRPFLNAA